MRHPKCITGELWTSRQRQCHSIHEISYRACFKPQLPNFFINQFSKRGDAVFDPFMGRGTTPIEAAMMGRRAIGSDINPLSVMLTRPRLQPPAIESIAARLGEIPRNGVIGESSHKLLVFYHPKVLKHIISIRKWLRKREKEGALDSMDDWIRMICLNRMSGHSPGFFSVRTMPPNQAVSVETQARLNSKNRKKPEMKDVNRIVLRKTKSLLRLPVPKMEHEAILKCSVSHSLCWIPDDSVDLTVTSPPFMNVTDYAKDNWLRCWFAGINPKRIRFAQHRKREAWEIFVQDTLMELQRITVPKGRIAFEVGDIHGGKTLLEEGVVSAARKVGLEVEKIYINKKKFTKTANCWKVENNKKGTNTNRIVLLRKI